MCTLAIMSRRKQLRPFKVQDDDDDDDDNNAKPAKKNADNGISTSSNGDNADATHNTSKLHVIFIILKVFFSLLLNANSAVLLGKISLYWLEVCFFFYFCLKNEQF